MSYDIMLTDEEYVLDQKPKARLVKLNRRGVIGSKRFCISTPCPEHPVIGCILGYANKPKLAWKDARERMILKASKSSEKKAGE